MFALTEHSGISLLAAEGGRSLRILTWLLALTSALLLFLLCITLGPIVAKWSSKKFPYLFKQRKANASWEAGGEAGQLCRQGSLPFQRVNSGP